MTHDEEEDLRAMGRDLAGALQSSWQPACIARAFATPDSGDLALTMQGWIDLDAAHSPLLAGGMPSTEAELDAAFAAFALGRQGLTTNDVSLVIDAMQTAVAEAFALALPMAPAASTPADAVTMGDDGFGSWLPLFACLVTQCGLLPQIALAQRVDRTFALVAAMRRNQGWQPTGTPYALREVSENSVAREEEGRAES